MLHQSSILESTIFRCLLKAMKRLQRPEILLLKCDGPTGFSVRYSRPLEQNWSMLFINMVRWRHWQLLSIFLQTSSFKKTLREKGTIVARTRCRRAAKNLALCPPLSGSRASIKFSQCISTQGPALAHSAWVTKRIGWQGDKIILEENCLSIQPLGSYWGQGCDLLGFFGTLLEIAAAANSISKEKIGPNSLWETESCGWPQEPHCEGARPVEGDLYEDLLHRCLYNWYEVCCAVLCAVTLCPKVFWHFDHVGGGLWYLVTQASLSAYKVHSSTTHVKSISRTRLPE